MIFFSNESNQRFWWQNIKVATISVLQFSKFGDVIMLSPDPTISEIRGTLTLNRILLYSLSPCLPTSIYNRSELDSSWAPRRTLAPLSAVEKQTRLERTRDRAFRYLNLCTINIHYFNICLYLNPLYSVERGKGLIYM